MEKIDPRREMEIAEEVKKTVLIPCPREMRDTLFLNDAQFQVLLGVNSSTYWDLMSGSKQFSTSQRLFLHSVLKIMKEKGLLGSDERDGIRPRMKHG